MSAAPYIIICILCWGTWAVFEKQATKHLSPMMIQIVGSYVYSIVAPVIFLYAKATDQPTTWNAPGILWTTAGCVLATIASLSFATAIQKAQVHTVVGFTSIYPALTFVLCAIFLSESVTLTKIFGICCIVAGTIILSLS